MKYFLLSLVISAIIKLGTTFESLWILEYFGYLLFWIFGLMVDHFKDQYDDMKAAYKKSLEEKHLANESPEIKETP